MSNSLVNWNRRKVLALAGAMSALSPTIGKAQGAPPVRIGFTVSKTGPLAGGAAVTCLPNYYLWVKTVNDAGGLNVGGIRRRIELIEYDDRTQSEEVVRNIERLITQDKVDLILAPYGTGSVLAAAPLLNRAGYPLLAGACVTDHAPELVKRWPNTFFFVGRSSSAAEALVAKLVSLRKTNGLGATVGMVSVQDQFGIELANATRPLLKRAGFNLVMDRQYPMESQDLSPLVAEAARANPQVFIACSYPPDTLALAEQARIIGFNPKVYYSAVGTAFPLFKEKFGANAEGVMGAGGLDTSNPRIRAYIDRHVKEMKQAPDFWASAPTYASLEMLQQAVERVGLDRAAIIRELSTGTFETILGKLKLKNNMREWEWWLGQWQGADFVAVGPATAPGVRNASFPKPAWVRT